MNRIFLKLACVLIGVSLGCIPLMGQNVMIEDIVKARMSQQWEKQRNSIVLSTGASIPGGDFSWNGFLPMVGLGYGNANTGRSFGLKYTNYFNNGFGITTSLEYKYFGVDYGHYSRALNIEPGSPIKGGSVSSPSELGLGSEGWNIYSISVGPSYRIGIGSQSYLDVSALIGFASCSIPGTEVLILGDDGKYSHFITMDSENRSSIYYKVMAGPTFPVGESVSISFGFGFMFGLRPSFTGHDFAFNEDGSRTPKKTTYPIASMDFSVGLGYSF